jgi:PadR family transcriptional regulator AphA
MSTFSMPARTATSYAILGLLSVRDWTTYELAKQVQRSLNWFWPRAERKLYDEPKNLVAEEWATARKAFTGQRPRTVYQITDAGREALKVWLDEPSAPRTTEFEAMLKVFFADAGTLDQLTGTIDAIETDTTQRLRELRDMAAQAAAGDTAFPQRQHISALALRLQYLQEAAVLEWTRWAREQTAGWRSSTDPGNWHARLALVELSADAQEQIVGE